MALNAKTITNKEYFYGHKACGGCGAALAIRLALKVLGDRAIAVIPPTACPPWHSSIPTCPCSPTA